MSEEREDNALSTAEAEALYRGLTPEEREELLQCLLVAAPRGGEAMIEILKQTLLCHATEGLLSGGPQ
jgi:hypothetical protein